jgi:hypothetical protein
MKQCPFCGIDIDNPAVVCTWCGNDLRTAAPQPDGAPRLMARPGNLGRIYGVVTGVLIATVSVSGWCWNSQNASGLPNLGLRDACLGIWALGGVLLTLSQLVFVLLAVNAKVTSARTAVLIAALSILAAIAVFVLALAQMPS